MKLYTVGFTQKSAEEFFEILKKNNIGVLLDIRLNNKSQLAGFAKGKDLKYFMKEICSAEYLYEPLFAPTKELLDFWKNSEITWEEYEYQYKKLLVERNAEAIFLKKYSNKIDKNICLLCSEPTPKYCHRRLLAEYLLDFSVNVEIIHI